MNTNVKNRKAYGNERRVFQKPTIEIIGNDSVDATDYIRPEGSRYKECNIFEEISITSEGKSCPTYSFLIPNDYTEGTHDFDGN